MSAQPQPPALETLPDALFALMATGERPRHRTETPAARAPLHTAPRPEPRVQRLSVVVPARNEAANLPALLAELDTALRSARLASWEVIVVDDGSTDETPQLAAACGALVVRHAESLGNGAAVKRGIREARGDWILLLDGDGQHPPAELHNMLALAERHDMVVGSRGGKGGSAHRNLANRVYNRFASYV